MVKNNIKKFMNNISKEDIKRARYNIKDVLAYLKDFCVKHPELNIQQSIDKLDDEFVETSNKYFDNIDRLSGSKIQFIACDYLLKNELFLKSQYQRLKNKTLTEENDALYTYDIEKSSKLLLRQLLFEIRRQLAKNNIAIVDEYTYLKNSLKNLKPQLLEIQKEDNIEILKTAKNFFDNYGITKKLQNNHNQQLHSLWLEDLNYTLEPNKQFPDDIGINNMLSEQNLKNMSLEQLSVLNIFWQNKYSKEQRNIGFGHFVLRQLKLFKNNNISTPKLNDDLIKNLLVKYNLLEKLCYMIYHSKGDKKSKTHYVDKISSDYKKLFDELLPQLDNDVYKDLTQCINRFMTIENTYAIKSNLICGTIASLVNNKKIKNWGYINDSKDPQQNSIKTNTQHILIGIDYPGFNRPICVHIEKNLLLDAIINSAQVTQIPIYQGNDDFSLNFEHLKTHLVLPLEKRHKLFLRSNKNFPPYSRSIVEHIQFLANQDKLPPSLKDENGRRKPRQYIDLFTGQVFSKTEKESDKKR